MSLSAEKTVLGAVLIDNSTLPSAIEILVPSDFSSKANAKIFECMCALAEESTPIDLVTLKNELVRRECLTDVGGVGYISGLVEGVPRLENVETWANIVKEASTLRRLAQVASSIGQWAVEGTESSNEILDRAESAIFSISDSRTKSGPSIISDGLKEAFQEIETIHDSGGGLTGLSTGLIDLDRTIDGLHGGDLVLLAARPAMGKTSMAMNIARNSASNGTIAVFSLEMSKKQLIKRMIFSEAMINSMDAKRGRLNDSDWRRLAAASVKLNSLPIMIDDTSFITPIEIRAKCRRIKSERGLKLVVLDYIQLVSSGVKRENSNQEVSFISRSLKALAKELDVPVLCLSQLSRGTERREDHRPQLSDLRDSGALEQDCDLCLFLYRDSVYNPNQDTEACAEVIIAKNRNGPTGIVNLRFFKEFTRFENAETKGF